MSDSISSKLKHWMLGCFEDFQQSFSDIIYRNLDAGDTQSLKFKWRDQVSNPEPLAPKAESLIYQPVPFP